MKGTTQITYCGHSTVLIRTETGKTVMIDPFLVGNPLCPKELHDPGHLDAIFLTHGHSDHTACAVRLAKKHGSMIFATYELAMLMIREGIAESQIQPMNKGGRVAIPHTERLAVTLTNAFHSSSYTASDGNTYYAGEPCGIVLELESGKAIYHAGDTCRFSDMKLIGEQFSIAVAFLPIGDRFTMDPSEAAKAVELLRPTVAIPIHYGTFGLLTGDPEVFSAAVKKTSTQPVILKPGSRYVIE